jgi:benzoyl-CoA reductase/2-hydroxyglutaryl-CoA dehydratase subunit BcrC/BadD/HgdB
MSLKSAIAYHGKVDLAGSTALGAERIYSELKAKFFSKPSHPNFNPPLRSIPRLKELIKRHYLEGRFADTHRKVAWVTSGGPVEFLKALGFFTLYPENHGAVCGVRRKVVELSAHAENLGFGPDLCSYARTDIGSLVSGDTPVGRLSRPDLLLCCNNICQTVLYWYQVLADHFKVPLVLIDTPFIYDEVTVHAVDYVTRQLEEAVATAERVAGKSLSQKSLRKTGRAAKDAMLLWREIMKGCENRPAPISAFDEFFLMAPIVDMRGQKAAVDFYRHVLDEVKERVDKGVGSLKNERKRLLWDNIPIWHHVRGLSEMLAEAGAALVASTYTNAWGELADMIDVDHVLESGARAYLHVILNRSAGHKLKTMKQMIRDYQIDGVIMHNDRSCKPYSMGQADQRDRLVEEDGVPALLLEADHNDPRLFSKEPVANRIAVFLELLK